MLPRQPASAQSQLELESCVRILQPLPEELAQASEAVAMKRPGLAWNVVMITPERQEQRMEQARPALRPTGTKLERVPQ